MGEEIIIDEQDFLFLELVHELWALGAHLDVLEHQILSWQQRNLGGSTAPLTEDSVEYENSPADHDELHGYLEDFENSDEYLYHDLQTDAEMQEQLDTVDYVLPRIVRSSFVVVLWAAYEAAVNEIARYLGRRRQLRMADLRGDFTDRSNKYFAKVLELTLHSSDDVRERLRVLEVVRHAIAHANGRLTGVREKNRKQIHLWIKQDRGISEEHGCVMLSQGFVRQAYADVKQEIERLIEIAKTEDGRAKASKSGTSDSEDR